jgi:dUTP pyrophosphatase
MDIRACIENSMKLNPGDIKLVPTGFAVSIPSGYEAQVRPRSGLALRYGIGMVNSPGTIDSDYRGEVGIVLINWGDTPVTIKRGDRIAQLVITEVYHAELLEVCNLENTGRGKGGFGHTGID